MMKSLTINTQMSISINPFFKTSHPMRTLIIATTFGIMLIHSHFSKAFDFMYVTNTGSNLVGVYDTNGVLQSTIGSSATLNGPTGIVFDISGNMFVASHYSNSISKFDSSGTFISSIFSSFKGAERLAFDSSGNLYAASSNGYLSKFDPSRNYLYRIQSGFSTPNYIAFHDGLTSTVPEPFSWILAGIGIIALGMTANRKPVFITKGTRLIAPILFVIFTAQIQL
jgi:DNA-binding beta-propeller fold protein YncE